MWQINCIAISEIIPYIYNTEAAILINKISLTVCSVGAGTFSRESKSGLTAQISRRFSLYLAYLTACSHDGIIQDQLLLIHTQIHTCVTCDSTKRSELTDFLLRTILVFLSCFVQCPKVLYLGSSGQSVLSSIQISY